MAGCSKKYTDPSSLRKHVKNHAVKDQQHCKKKGRDAQTIKLNNLSESVRTAVPLHTYNHFAPINDDKPSSPEDNNFIFDEMFMDIKKENFDEQNANNTMNLHEMSKCIVTIQDDNTFSYNFEPDDDKNTFNTDNLDGLHFDQADEYVSIECIKKLLGEENVDYIGTTLQSHLNEEYFNQIH